MVHENLEHVCAYLDLGSLDAEPKPVFGGLIHKMWQITTPKGMFATKELSKLIHFDDEKKKEYELSEEIARKLRQAGTPAITALIKSDKHSFH